MTEQETRVNAETTPADPVKVARDLREILQLATALEDQAISKGDDQLMPGGLAMVALGPVANLEQYEHKLNTAEEVAQAKAFRLGLRWKDVIPAIEDEDNDLQALQLLLFWSEAWRIEHGMEFEAEPRRPRPTLATEANFIGWALGSGWAWNNEIHFDDFAADVNDARRRLENLLYAGVRHERTRVRCDRDPCERKPQLIRTHDPRILVWRCTTCGTDHEAGTEPDLCSRWFECGNLGWLEPAWFSDPAKDAYACTCCKTKFNEVQFRAALAKQLRSEGAERFVVLGDAIATLKGLGRGSRTITKWTRVPEHIADRCTVCGVDQEPDEYGACPEVVPPLVLLEPYCGGELVKVWDPDLEEIVEGWCELGSRRRWVWWPDLWRLHLASATRRRTRSA